MTQQKPAATPNIESILQENRVFNPPADFSRDAHIKSMDDYRRLYDESLRNPEKFWGQAADELHWFTKWSKVRDWNPPFAKWFTDGRTNISYNCLDRHLASARKNKAALIWEGEPGDTRTFTYQQLYRQWHLR